MKSPKYLIAAAALSGLLAGAANRSMAMSPASSASHSAISAMSSTNGSFGIKANALADDTTKGKHDCKGKNACKGQGGCKTGDAGCKGKNSCKGKGGCKTNEAPKEPKLFAAAGFDLGAVALALADDTTKGKHDCKGKNACKGQGGCKTGDAGCKAKNSCKGKGGCKTNEAPKEPKLLAAAGFDLVAMAPAFAANTGKL